MRTNIEIDPTLIEHVMKSGDFRTRKAAVDAGLRLLAKIQGQAAIRQLRGKFQWEGNLGESRRGRLPDWDLPETESNRCSS